MKERVVAGIAITIFGICQWLLGYVAGYASGESETVKKNLEETKKQINLNPFKKKYVTIRKKETEEESE